MAQVVTALTEQTHRLVLVVRLWLAATAGPARMAALPVQAARAAVPALAAQTATAVRGA